MLCVLLGLNIDNDVPVKLGLFSCLQLRNLVWATSKHDVYLMQNYSLMHWSSLLRRGKEVLNVAKPIEPTQKYPGSLDQQTLSRVQISTMAVKDNLLVAGGFQGELICKFLSQPGVAFSTKIATDENAITNAVDIYHNSNGSIRVMTANNDAHVRVFDAGNFACLSRFSFPWSVNNTSVSPDGQDYKDDGATKRWVKLETTWERQNSPHSVHRAHAGESERILRDAFAEASSHTKLGKPSVIFIDEIDALCPRHHFFVLLLSWRNYREKREQDIRVASQLFMLMDSNKPSAKSKLQVVVVASTNRLMLYSFVLKAHLVAG
ncbi:hypothetical protein RHSIM_Rhsim07G0164700 [Rhododendron simsii]|uniref:ATPase AAA-type core domain-containing protein n=1 Tax=Rhododendron simsii TaxID=118357 RepID=A0A834LKE4_RHOSS|nr:hypothetical protein RHSIM_Rhsim07G0164700 [Rhododendron simsii]